MDLNFPIIPEEFDSDDRISFSKVDKKFIAVHDDGSEYEFDADLKKWVPADDEPLEEFDAGDQGSATPVDDDSSKKRKNGSQADGEVSMAVRAADGSIDV